MKRGFVLGFVLFAALFATAPAQAEDVRAETGVRNAAPVVTEIDLGSSDDQPSTAGVQVAPVPGGVRTVTVSAKAQDDNGWKDVSGLSFTLQRDGVTLAGPVQGAASKHGGRAREYSASFSLDSAARAGPYAVVVEATDVAGAKASSSASFEFLGILAFTLEGGAISFSSGGLEPGATTHGSPAARMLRNTGNVPLSISVAATDLEGGVKDARIPADRIRYSASSDMSNERALGETPFIDTSFRLDPGSGASRAAYFDIHVPSGEEQYIPATTYKGSIRIGVVVSE